MSAPTRALNAVVTGASSGIGRAIALAIASSSSSLCITGRNIERLESVARQARKMTGLVLTQPADLTLDSEIHHLQERIQREFKEFNVLVHCAGSFATGTIAATPVKELDALYRANVRLPYALTQALLPMLISARGQIVFVNSSQGLQAKAGSGPFASTQHAVKALADSLRQEVNARGVRVLNIFPGRTATARMEKLFELEGSPYRPDLLLQPGDIGEAVLSALRMPRTAEVTSIEIRPLVKSY